MLVCSGSSKALSAKIQIFKCFLAYVTLNNVYFIPVLVMFSRPCDRLCKGGRTCHRVLGQEVRALIVK